MMEFSPRACKISMCRQYSNNIEMESISDHDVDFMKSRAMQNGYNHPLPCLETQFFSIGLLVLPILQVPLIRSQP
jgi:hypothetical protein